MSAAQPPSEAAGPDEPSDPLGSSASEPSASFVGDRGHSSMPQLYIACPLTGLDEDRERLEATSHRVETVQRAVIEETETNRIDGEKWPVTMHVPFKISRPGADGGLMPTTIYGRNLDALLDSDGLIVVTDRYCSAGIGQEIEWATRAGIPILYLSHVQASRQILGTPHNVTGVVCEDADTMAGQVRIWLRTHRAQIQTGPGRRADRNLAYLQLTARLRTAWEQSTDRTPQAAQLKLQPGSIDSLVASPARVALTPWWTICELAMILGVSLEARRSLTYAESRAWVKAVEDAGWDQKVADRLRSFAVTNATDDLELPATWAVLYQVVYPPPRQ
ncbi:hypothetical protein [Nocardioides renjunii]|uniref:hypothetical protein n=1 Tax=Nocardioides renjunii TaxID=3095075 RepID=UPI002AFF7956|nr:hypothetical protein [Nocardioides sp. S-34]WQQ23874.1 hypothetical protein SHK17_07775 [Nocardioides sp. S-34]